MGKIVTQVFGGTKRTTYSKTQKNPKKMGPHIDNQKERGNYRKVENNNGR